MTKTDKRTSYLLKRRTFWTGFSSVLNMFGEKDILNTSKSATEADRKAIQSDWEMIGKDIKDVMSKLM